MDNKIKQAKKIFDILVEEFTKDSKNQEILQYDPILNIIFVFLGIRPMALFMDKTKLVSKLLKKHFGSNPELEIISKESPIDKKFDRIYFINKEEIKKKDLTKELQQFIDDDKNHKLIGKLLDYACPSNIILEATTHYNKQNGDELRRRYVFSYEIYEKTDKNIILDKNSQLYAYVCYSDKKKDQYYKGALKKLKLYQKILAQITDKLHIGFEFKEEII